MCFSSGARPAGIVIPVCCRIIENQARGCGRLCAGGKGVLEKPCVSFESLVVGGGTIISVVTRATR